MKGRHCGAVHTGFDQIWRDWLCNTGLNGDNNPQTRQSLLQYAGIAASHPYRIITAENHPYVLLYSEHVLTATAAYWTSLDTIPHSAPCERAPSAQACRSKRWEQKGQWGDRCSSYLNPVVTPPLYLSEVCPRGWGGCARHTHGVDCDQVRHGQVGAHAAIA